MPNPTVMIQYQPENAPIALAKEVASMIACLDATKAITDAEQLEAASIILDAAKTTASDVDVFVDNLRSSIQLACARVRELPGYEDFEATLTVRTWGLRKRLTEGITRVRNFRASYISAEEERVRRAKIVAQQEQERLNRLEADRLAKEAAAAKADTETIEEIKEVVMATPAPVVVSESLDTAKEMKASVRYAYSAKITNFHAFIVGLANNQALYNTLVDHIDEIEGMFRKQAMNEKENFNYPGITFEKRAVDVGRR
jgi:hypothetical protein